MKQPPKPFKLFRENMGVGGLGGGPPTNNISGGNIALYDPVMQFTKRKKESLERRKPPNNKKLVI